MLNKLNDLSAHNQRFATELSDAIDRVRASGWFALGPEVEAFEAEFAEYCGAPHCVGVANGSDALELALRPRSHGCHCGCRGPRKTRARYPRAK